VESDQVAGIREIVGRFPIQRLRRPRHREQPGDYKQEKKTHAHLNLHDKPVSQIRTFPFITRSELAMPSIVPIRRLNLPLQ
jgi:hypothetical protein